MYISQGTYFAYFLWSLLGGVLLGVLYDVFRIIRIASARESGGGLPDAVRNGRLKKRSGNEDGKDGSRVCRKGFRRGTALASGYYDRLFWFSVFVEDILFFLIAACVMALITYQMNYGRFRWFSLAAACGGFAAYYFTVGRLVMLISGTLLLMIRKLLGLIWRMTAVPIRKIFVWCFGRLVRMLKRRAAMRRTVREEKRMLRDAGDGFRERRARNVRRL